MATPEGFQLGLLPERKLDRRALAASYGLLVFLIIVMINIGWIWPDSLNITRQYHVTELIPMPSLQPQPLKVKAPARTLRAKLLPKAPVFDAPKLTVPREIPITLNPREHLRYVWLPFREAADKCFSPSNAEAILQLQDRQGEGARKRD